jgi:hypothetical protein
VGTPCVLQREILDVHITVRVDGLIQSDGPVQALPTCFLLGRVSRP